MKFLRDKNQSENPPKITVTLTKGGIITRVVFMVIMLILAIIAFFTVFSSVLRTKPGWQTIPMTKKDTVASDEFILNYEIGINGRAPSSEYGALTKYYSEVLDKNAKIFSKDSFDGVSNLYSLNHNPNKEITLEPKLYDALKYLENSGVRVQYYAPIYEIMRGMSRCQNDYEAYDYNPIDNPDIAKYYREILGFANDEKHINIEFLGDNKVKLNLSKEYSEYAADNEIEALLDFYRLKNAFVLDATADELIQYGYTSGIISCAEGYSRALGEGNYSVNRFEYKAGALSIAETVDYTGPKSVVSYNSFPVSQSDYDYFYVAEDGNIFTPFLDEEGDVIVVSGDLRGEILTSESSVISILLSLCR